MTEIFVAKFALKSGIHLVDAEVDAKGTATVKGAFPWLVMKLSKTDYALTLEEAQKKARAMALAKANKLEREAAELRALFQQEGE